MRWNAVITIGGALNCFRQSLLFGGETKNKQDKAECKKSSVPGFSSSICLLQNSGILRHFFVLPGEVFGFFYSCQSSSCS